MFDGAKVVHYCAIYLHSLKKLVNIPIGIRFSIENLPNLIIGISCLIVGVSTGEFIIAPIVVVTHIFVLFLCLTAQKYCLIVQPICTNTRIKRDFGCALVLRIFHNQMLLVWVILQVFEFFLYLLSR